MLDRTMPRVSDPVRAAEPVTPVGSPPEAHRATPATYVISADRFRMATLAREMWTHRELAYFLAWRDVKVRYKQAALGVGWAVLRPLLMVGVFTLVFSSIAHVKTTGVPYPVFALIGLMIWTFFSSAVLAASDSLVNNGNLLSKVYFPRLSLPLGAVVAQLPDLLVAVLMVAVALVAYAIVPPVTVLLLPLVLALTLLAALGMGTWLAAINVTYRDVKYVVPFLMQVWLFATPVVYPATLLQRRFWYLNGVNPAEAPVELARWALLGQAPASWIAVAGSVAVSGLLLVTGLMYFRRVESNFADVI